MANIIFGIANKIIMGMTNSNVLFGKYNTENAGSNQRDPFYEIQKTNRPSINPMLTITIYGCIIKTHEPVFP